MITKINYADTIGAYINYKEPISNLIMRKWWKAKTKAIPKDKSKTNNLFENWCYHTNDIYLRYFPDLNGRSLLFISFSLPKIYTSTDNNCNNVTNFDSSILDAEIINIIGTHIDKNQIPPSILNWQVSRLDLFYTHIVPLQDKVHYLDTYKLLYLPRYQKFQYKNTSYLMTNLKEYRSASVVVRIYDKDIEMYDKGIFTKENTLFYPAAVHKDIEQAIEIENEEYQYFYVNGCYYSRVRIELQLRRKKLIYTLKSKSITVSDVFNESFQTSIINKYFIDLGLDRKILSAYNFRSYIDTKGFRKSKRNNIIKCTTLLRNKRSPYRTGASHNRNGTIANTVSRQTFNGYANLLKADGIHILTNKDIDLRSITLL